jgi:hypothetical protein
MQLLIDHGHQLVEGLFVTVSPLLKELGNELLVWGHKLALPLEHSKNEVIAGSKNFSASFARIIPQARHRSIHSPRSGGSLAVQVKCFDGP